MTITSDVRVAEAVASGSSSLFDMGSGFKVFNANEVRVFSVTTGGVVTELTSGTGAANYAITTALDGTEARSISIRFPADDSFNPTAGFKIRAVSNIPLTQDTQYNNQTPYLPKEIEKSFDRLTIITQQIQEQVDRSFKVAIGSDEDVDQLIDNLFAAETTATAAASTASTAASTATAASAAAVAAVGAVKVTTNDTTAAVLDTTLLVGSGLTKTVNNPGANETLTLNVATAIANTTITAATAGGIKLRNNAGEDEITAGAVAGEIDCHTNKLVNVVDPTSAQDAATKAYADIKAGTAVATTSGTAINFGSLPAGIRRLTLVFDKVSTNGTGSNFVRIGTSGGLATTGYSGSLTTLVSGSVTTASTTSAFGFESGGASVTAASTRSGRMVIERLTGNIWAATTNIGLGNTGAVYVACTSVDIGAELTQVELTNAGGDTYDSGNLNVLWEF